MLSPLGRRLYFPKGILSQSAEAKEKGHRFNATIGIATERGAADAPAVGASRRSPASRPTTPYNYAPAPGRPSLRERWREKQLAREPEPARQGASACRS